MNKYYQLTERLKNSPALYEDLTSGFDTHTINNHKLKKGIYIISLVVNGEKINKRLIIN